MIFSAIGLHSHTACISTCLFCESAGFAEDGSRSGTPRHKSNTPRIHHSHRHTLHKSSRAQCHPQRSLRHHPMMIWQPCSAWCFVLHLGDILWIVEASMTRNTTLPSEQRTMPDGDSIDGTPGCIHRTTVNDPPGLSSDIFCISHSLQISPT